MTTDAYNSLVPAPDPESDSSIRPDTPPRDHGDPPVELHQVATDDPSAAASHDTAPSTERPHIPDGPPDPNTAAGPASDPPRAQPQARTRRADRRAAAPNDGEMLRKMYELAEAAGSQLRQSSANPAMLRGFCPLHSAGNTNSSKTLVVNTRTGRFACRYCETGGDAPVFAAAYWRMSVAEARLALSQCENPTTERPQVAHTNAANPNFAPQNTAVLTRAHQIFQQQLNDFIPLQYLAMLRIDPPTAAEIGLGFSTGLGLRRALMEDDVTDDEAAESPLFRNGLEALAGRITISDTDQANGVLWIGSLHPSLPKESRWPPTPPNFFGLSGLRPYVFGLSASSERPDHVIVTDDVRLYVVARANKRPAAIIFPRRADPVTVVNRVCVRSPSRITLAIHNIRIRDELIAQFATDRPQVELLQATRSQILPQLDPYTRDLDKLGETPAAATARRAAAAAAASEPTDPAEPPGPDADSPASELSDSTASRTATDSQPESDRTASPQPNLPAHQATPSPGPRPESDPHSNPAASADTHPRAAGSPANPTNANGEADPYDGPPDPPEYPDDYYEEQS